MLWTIPNLLSLFRIVAAPFLLLVAWLGERELFLLLFSAMLLSDVLDGFLARMLDQTSEFGARLDSYGDIVTYLSMPLALWWLFPSLFLQERGYIALALFLYVLPSLFAVAKFGTLVSYHTWITKLSAVLMSVGVMLLFLGETREVFHVGVWFLALEAMENIAITWMLSSPSSNIRSVWHAWQKQKRSL